MNEIILACSELEKSFYAAGKKNVVLRSINLAVKSGEMVAIVGNSGSGKSTLLHILGGLDVPSKGTVFLHNKKFSHLPEARKCYLRNNYLGFVYQFHHLLPEFSALENVAMPLLLRGGINLTEIYAKATDLLVAVGLAKQAQYKPYQLSGGERQRVAIARALVTAPVCVLADEPTGNLDPPNATKVLHLLLHLQNMLQLSLVVVTHDPRVAQQAQRVFTISNGYLHAS